MVPLGARVDKGQPVATLADAFGRVTDVLTAPETGTVSSIATDPRAARGTSLMRILWRSPAPECSFGCP
jgi:predicted deacylase